MGVLSRKEIIRSFELLDAELHSRGVEGELFLVGGAVMCLAYNIRPSTRDVDAFFKPARVVREAAAAIAARYGMDQNWLNNGVKGYLSDQGEFERFLELPNLRVMVASADYMLAMKCLALRIGAEFHDLDDVRYLIRHLDLNSYDQTVKTITRFYPLERFPQKTLYALEELFNRGTVNA
jgi:hypothetical protein